MARIFQGEGRNVCSYGYEAGPWYVVQADNKRRARLNCIAHLLHKVHYEDLTPKPIDLPARQDRGHYVRPPMTDQTFVAEIY